MSHSLRLLSLFALLGLAACAGAVPEAAAPAAPAAEEMAAPAEPEPIPVVCDESGCRVPG